MTAVQFKDEVLADLRYQRDKKSRPWTSEYWYLSPILYDLESESKKIVITELIDSGLIRRAQSTEFLSDPQSFPVLVLQ